MMSWLAVQLLWTLTDIVVGVVVMRLSVVVATRLCQAKVETFIMWTGQIQAIDTAEVQPRVGARIWRGQTNLICHKPDVQSLKPT